MGRKIHVVLEIVIPKILLVNFDFEIKLKLQLCLMRWERNNSYYATAKRDHMRKKDYEAKIY